VTIAAALSVATGRDRLLQPTTCILLKTGCRFTSSVTIGFHQYWRVSLAEDTLLVHGVPPPTDFKLVRAGHKCEHCYKNSHTIGEIRLAAENQCPSARIWLASIGWAASRFDYTDISFETHTQFTIMIGFVTREIFELDSRLEIDLCTSF
jgi:hypothetical protein